VKPEPEQLALAQQKARDFARQGRGFRTQVLDEAKRVVATRKARKSER
jgi:hypothetical protein